MYNRTYNFSAGPATMPVPVLEEIRDELEPSRYIGRCPQQVAALTAACRKLTGADVQKAEEITL